MRHKIWFDKKSEFFLQFFLELNDLNVQNKLHLIARGLTCICVY